MAEYHIRVDDLKNDGKHPVAKSVILLKAHISNDDIIHDLDLALTEAVANVVRHAYPGDATGPLDIRIRLARGRYVELSIQDQGRGISCELPDRELPEPQAEHGRGIPLMTKLCDRVDFHCDDKSNTVTMIKNIPPQAWRD